MIRVLLLLLLLFIFINSSFFLTGQITFNKRMSIGFPQSILTSIEITDSCYYASGVIGDSIAPYRTGNIFVKMDLDGEILFAKKITDSLKTFETWKNEFRQIYDGSFLNGGYGLDNGGRVFLVKQSTEGDTAWIRNFRSPYFPAEPFITFQGVVSNPDSTYVLASIIWNDFLSKNQMYLIKVKESGEILWEKQYNEGIYNSTPRNIVKVEDGYIVVGGIENLNLNNNNFISRTWIIKVNESGETEWEFLSPQDELQKHASDLILTSDGGYVIATAKGLETPVNNTTSTLRWQHYIYKLNSDREFEWGVDIRDITPSENFFNKLIHLSDDTGYVAVGSIFEDTPEPGYNINGLITKISTTGDSLWTRYYNYVQSPADNHIFYDVEETVDGGFIMVGEATNNMATADPPLQQAWIVKVDQYGCLVPGCHLIDATEDQFSDVRLQVYPNPTTDYLNVFYYAANHAGEIQYRIIDLQGKIHRSFSSSRNDITHVIPVSNLPAGQYYLTLDNEEGRLWSEAFVKQ